MPTTIAGMAEHLLAFADALGLTQIDLLGFSLGGMVAQQAALDRPSLVRKMLLVGTAPEGGEDIMHLEKPELSRILGDPSLSGYQVLVKLFFTPSESSQAAGQAFATRLAARTEDREPLSGPKVAQAQIAAFRAWERVDGERFGKLRRITQPCLVVNGVLDTMIPVRNSYLLAEHLPNAMLLAYPDAGHGSPVPVPRLLRAAGAPVSGLVTPSASNGGSSTHRRSDTCRPAAEASEPRPVRLAEGKVMRAKDGSCLMAGPCDLTPAGIAALAKDRSLGPRPPQGGAGRLWRKE